MKTQCYDFDVEYTPGKTHKVADALSRAPVFSPPEAEPTVSRVTAGEPELETDKACHCNTLSCPLSSFTDDEMSTRTLHGINAAHARTLGIDYNLLELIEQAKKDDDYQEIVKAFQKGADPKMLKQSHPARQFASFWDKM